jgi:hypothetical protein
MVVRQLKSLRTPVLKHIPITVISEKTRTVPIFVIFKIKIVFTEVRGTFIICHHIRLYMAVLVIAASQLTADFAGPQCFCFTSWICGGECGTGTGFSLSFGFPMLI